MGLTKQSTGLGSLKEMFEVKKESSDDIVIALAGNPNTGKSTVFNSLTGLKQHTGNWPGKTVTNAQGSYYHKNQKHIVVDLPGTYSLFANSAEEEVARDFICFGKPHVTIVVLDATCLERNLNLTLQILEITSNVVVCVNLLDEATRKKIKVDLEKLSDLLGVPVVGTNARDNVGLQELKDIVYKFAQPCNSNHKALQVHYNEQIEKAIALLEPPITRMVNHKINARWIALRLFDNDRTILDSLSRYLSFDLLQNIDLKEHLKITKASIATNATNIRDQIVENIIKQAESIGAATVVYETQKHNSWDRKIDSVLTSRMLGIPLMLALLGLIFWITIQGANIPSGILASGFDYFEEYLTKLFLAWGSPAWLHGLLVLGIYRTLSWVISVMLPPMAIFFPLFTLLEDLGYLPRVAFNMDSFFKKACAHGKQALTMCMGFGCNAAGIIGCRIIDSPRERLIATITNNFVPCNGRFPTLIALASIFIASNMGPFQSVGAAISVLAVIALGVTITLFISKFLSKTVLIGLSSSFTLELPPYRKPKIGRIIVRSIFDRTLFVLSRAVLVAAPAGAFIWLIANTNVGDISILNHCANFLDPFAHLLGLDGFILLAFILGLPANEIVLPILIMSYMSQGAMLELESLDAMRQLFLNNGWTWLTAVCTMLFILNHWPCGTSLLTIHKETQSLKWTFLAFLVPTITGMLICFAVAQATRILGLVS
ncbi:MAG: ferrous iron transport protein B [Firmicutes bacterium HGW-Firmicutes-12]|jgi:ferrous iron transport protein B|nr:MAG: ferrous iron transport protein B [Firmicutes bacterium HGW-Firmicutes-12]